MSDIYGLLVALKKWQKSIEQLKRKGKASHARSRQTENARREVLSHLSDPAVTQDIDELIQTAIASKTHLAENVRKTLIKDSESLVATELKTVTPLSVKRKDFEKLASHFLKTPDSDQPIDSSDDLKTIFLKLSLVIPQEYRETTQLSRKQKKKRRRDLTLGTLQTALGIGLLAGNTQLDSFVANSSYILGGNALMQAMHNLIGRLPGDDPA